MKTVRNIRGLALSGVAALGLIAMTPAFAESDYVTGNGPISASADLDFQVNIPRFISFQVGSAGTVVDLVQFDVNGNDVGNGTPVARTGGAAVPVTLVSNVGNVTLSASGSNAGLEDGTSVIPWSTITGSSSNAAELPVPAIGGAGTGLTATNGVINATADWTFQYANSDIVAAGTYEGTVTYTVTAP